MTNQTRVMGMVTDLTGELLVEFAQDVAKYLPDGSGKDRIVFEGREVRLERGNRSAFMCLLTKDLEIDKAFLDALDHFLRDYVICIQSRAQSLCI